MNNDIGHKIEDGFVGTVIKVLSQQSLLHPFSSQLMKKCNLAYSQNYGIEGASLMTLLFYVLIYFKWYSGVGGWRSRCWGGSRDRPWQRGGVDGVDCRRESVRLE